MDLHRQAISQRMQYHLLWQEGTRYGLITSPYPGKGFMMYMSRRILKRRIKEYRNILSSNNTATCTENKACTQASIQQIITQYYLDNTDIGG